MRCWPLRGGADGVWAFVREHLRHLPVTDGRRGKARVVRERHADRIYDRMVAFHVSSGLPVPMTAPEFFTGHGIAVRAAR